MDVVDDYVDSLNRSLIDQDVLDEEDTGQQDIGHNRYNLPFDIKDHFTLRSTIFRFRNRIVMDGIRHQMIFSVDDQGIESNMNDNNKPLTITARRATRYGGLATLIKFLLVYVMMFMSGVALAYCVLIFLQYGLGVFLVGIRSSKPMDEQIAAFLTLFSLPAFLDFFSYVLTIGTGALSDIWNDYEYFNTFTLMSPFVRDWVRLLLTFLIPVSILAVSMMTRSESATAIFLLSALLCNVIMLLFYVFYTVWLEVYSCVRIIQSCHPAIKDTWSALYQLGYVRAQLAFARTADVTKSPLSLKELITTSSFKSYLFYPLEKPKKVWRLESVLRPKPIYTRVNGSMLFLCCMMDNRFRGSIPRAVFDNSMLCAAITALLVWLLIVGYLSYLTVIPTVVGVLAACISAMVCIWWVYSIYTKYVHTTSFSSYGDENDLESSVVSNRDTITSSESPYFSERRFSMSQAESDSDIDDISEPSRINMDAYERSREHKVTTYIYAYPKTKGAVILIGIQFLFFLLFPTYGFFHLGTNGYGVLCFIAAVSKLRLYVFDVEKLIEAYGPRALSSLDLPLFDSLKASSTSSTELRPRMSSPRSLANSLSSHGARRVYFLLTRMRKRQIQSFWFSLYGFAVFVLIILVAISVDSDTSSSDYSGAKLAGNSSHRTHFIPSRTDIEAGFMYPLCTLFNDMYENKDPTARTPWHTPYEWNAMDFVFISDIAYSRANTTQHQLDAWFSDNSVQYISPSEYPKYAKPKNSSAVFKLFKVKQKPTIFRPFPDELYLISIRGTTKPFDLLADMQIWFPAMMLQLVRFILPLASIWDPIFPYLIWYTNALESAPASELSYVSDLISFTRELKRKNPKSKILLTGHSLGGGVAMIVGAKEHIPAVAISGPNALLSRFKFGVDQQSLNQYTLNIIPRDDPVPLIDDQGLLTETILCRAKKQEGGSMGACHSVTRTLCEIQYICGSGFRPPVADCRDRFGFYPDPTPLK